MTALMDTTWSTESAQNVLPDKLMMNTLKPAAFLLAQDTTKNTPPSLKHASASLDTSRSEESAQLATLATTTTATVTDVSANQATKRKTVSVSQSVLPTKPTSTEDASAQLVKA